MLKKIKIPIYHQSQVFILLFLLFSCGSGLFAQEYLVPLKHQSQMHHVAQYFSGLRGGLGLQDTLCLPFVDDFSGSKVILFPQGGSCPEEVEYNNPVKVWVNPLLWDAKGIYQNRHLAIKSPSIGVATFDGLDSLGNPYAESPVQSFADELASRPIYLGSRSPSDSVILSFFYQSTGLGNNPNDGDQLMLEFLDIDSNWVNIWTAQIVSAPTTTFDSVYVAVDESRYFYDGFRFRFRNIATLSGANDHWHIDYVFMDDNRDRSIRNLNDVMVRDGFQEPLIGLRDIPRRHFEPVANEKLMNTLFFTTFNHFNVVKNVNPTVRAVIRANNCPDELIANQFYGTINHPPLQSFTSTGPGFREEFIDWMENNPDCDEFTLETVYFFDPVSADPNPVNDTLILRNHFKSWMAYDDGSSEAGYGITGAGSQMAIKFPLEVPDSVYGVQIHFTHVLEDVSKKLFSIRIWNDIGIDGGTDDLAYEQILEKPMYIDSINGFATYAFDEPVAVENEFYAGWIQDGNDNLAFGFDLNTDASGYRYFFNGSEWVSSLISGALMFRPVFQAVTSSDVKTVKQAGTLKVFPNPVNDYAWIKPKLEKGDRIELFELSGRMILEKHGPAGGINVGKLKSGIYLLRISEENGRNLRLGKLIKH